MNDFEKAANEIEQDRNYENDCENAIEFLKGSDIATVTFSQGRFINKIYKLAEKYPDEVEIVAENKNSDGSVRSIVAYIPVHYIRISNLKKELSDEERNAMRDRFNVNVRKSN